MLELGQPMHAFDAREINTGKIVVERARRWRKIHYIR